MPDTPEHPAAYACRYHNERLARSGSPLRWVTRPGGEMGLVSLNRPHGTSMAENGGRP